MIGRLRRLQLGLELVRGAVLVVAGGRMVVAAAREFLAADKAATVAYLEGHDQAVADEAAAADAAPELEPEPAAGGDDAA